MRPDTHHRFADFKMEKYLMKAKYEGSSLNFRPYTPLQQTGRGKYYNE